MVSAAHRARQSARLRRAARPDRDGGSAARQCKGRGARGASGADEEHAAGREGHAVFDGAQHPDVIRIVPR